MNCFSLIILKHASDVRCELNELVVRVAEWHLTLTYTRSISGWRAQLNVRAEFDDGTADNIFRSEPTDNAKAFWAEAGDRAHEYADSRRATAIAQLQRLLNLK